LASSERALLELELELPSGWLGQTAGTDQFKFKFEFEFKEIGRGHDAF
jgi:hypothetical protein